MAAEPGRVGTPAYLSRIPTRESDEENGGESATEVGVSRRGFESSCTFTRRLSAALCRRYTYDPRGGMESFPQRFAVVFRRRLRLISAADLRRRNAVETPPERFRGGLLSDTTAA